MKGILENYLKRFQTKVHQNKTANAFKKRGIEGGGEKRRIINNKGHKLAMLFEVELVLRYWSPRAKI